MGRRGTASYPVAKHVSVIIGRYAHISLAGIISSASEMTKGGTKGDNGGKGAGNGAVSGSQDLKPDMTEDSFSKACLSELQHLGFDDSPETVKQVKLWYTDTKFRHLVSNAQGQERQKLVQRQSLEDTRSWDTWTTASVRKVRDQLKAPGRKDKQPKNAAKNVRKEKKAPRCKWQEILSRPVDWEFEDGGVATGSETVQQLLIEGIVQGASGMGWVNMHSWAEHVKGVRSNLPLAALLPASLADVQKDFPEDLRPPREIFAPAYDPVKKTTSMVPTTIVQLGKGVIRMANKKPDIKFEISNEVELVLEVAEEHSDAKVWRTKETPRELINRLLARYTATIPNAAYGYKERGEMGARLRQCIVRFPENMKQLLMQKSGAEDLFVRICIRVGHEMQEYAVVWLEPKTTRQEALRVGKETPGYSGLARNMKCVGVRVLIAELAAARRKLAPDDKRFTPSNIGLDPKKEWLVEGVPFGVQPNQLVDAMEQWGWIVVPKFPKPKKWTREWIVLCDSAPPSNTIYIENGMCIISPVLEGVDMAADRARVVLIGDGDTLVTPLTLW